MKNPFRYFSRSRGLPDPTVHHGGEGDCHNSSYPPPAAAQLLVPAGYPADTASSSCGGDDQLDPPTAYPYHAHQGEKEKEATWEFNAGNNKNIRGQQRTGNIIVGNTCNGAPLPINLPQNGRFVFYAGGNTNEGELQEVGGIEFANVRS